MEKAGLATARQATLVPSEAYQEGHAVEGPDFNHLMQLGGKRDGEDRLSLLTRSLSTMGFQSTQLAKAIEEVNGMLQHRDAEGCFIFLGYTSNMVSSGVREVIRFLVEHRLVDALVTTAGGVEEDIIKCLAPTVIGDWHLKGEALRSRGLNRIGNLLVPNDNYCRFEDWLMPRLDQMATEAKADWCWTPSKVCERLGREINDERSILYWAAKHEIPVFCPALTDGSLGDMLYFHSYRHRLIIDIVEDIRRINNLAVHAPRTGAIILGGGVIKHHIMNANLMRNGAEHLVIINTANEWDGSDAGANCEEAISWGKIKSSATPVKIHSEVSLVFPILVAETFARYLEERRRKDPIVDHLYI